MRSALATKRAAPTGTSALGQTFPEAEFPVLVGSDSPQADPEMVRYIEVEAPNPAWGRSRTPTSGLSCATNSVLKAAARTRRVPSIRTHEIPGLILSFPTP